MPFKGTTTEDLISIMREGTGIRLNAAELTTDELIRIAAAAIANKGRLILVGISGRDPSDLERIRDAGAGRVIFED